MITFITGNTGKFAEAQAILEGIELVQKSLHLPEIQELDPRLVLREKLAAAQGIVAGACIVEDSSLTLECLEDALPGPFIKWFEDALGVSGIYELTKHYGNSNATIHTHVGYVDEQGSMQFFEASMKGAIVAPRGDKDFGYGPIFMPEGSLLTFGEMERDQKHVFSSRGIAFRSLRDSLAQANA